MKPDSQDFQDLRRFLALKRHEQPPPGYFEHFSAIVMARIRAGEQAQDSLWERLCVSVPWFQRLWSSLEARPAVAGAFGMAVCALLVAGVSLTDQPDSNALAVLPLGLQQHTLVSAATQATEPGELLERATVAEFSSTDGAAPEQLRASLFRTVRTPQRSWFEGVAEPAVFRPALR